VVLTASNDRSEEYGGCESCLKYPVTAVYLSLGALDAMFVDISESLEYTNNS
jgi:hypothetical protein